MPTHPYIHFQGQCAAAMTACAAIFGSAPPQRMHDADAPGAPGAFKASGRIMPAQVALFDGTLMGSDYPPGREGEAQKRVSVMQSAPNFDTGARIFAALAKGGAVIEDHNSSFFTKGFGRVEDRFGTHWIITAGEQAP